MLWFLKTLKVKQNECTLYTKQGLLWRQMHYIRCKGLTVCNDRIFLFIVILLQLHLAVCRQWLQCFHHHIWESLETPASDISMNLLQYSIFEVIMMGVFCTFFWYRPSDIIIEWHPMWEQFTNHNTDFNILVFSRWFLGGFLPSQVKQIHPQVFMIF